MFEKKKILLFYNILYFYSFQAPCTFILIINPRTKYQSMNNVLNNLNALNRSLEGVVAVGKEFESVSLLWNNYYDGLARVEIHQQQEQQQQQQHEQQQQHQENAQPDEPRQSTDQQGDVEPSGI